MSQPQKLNQVLAVEKGTKGRVESQFTAVFQQMKKKGLFQGMTRIYSPKKDGDEQLPEERQFVQARVEDQFGKIRDVLGELFNLTATKDTTNTLAKANIIVDGEVLLKDVPVTHLLWLENKLRDLITFVRELPALDPAYPWEWDASQALWRTPAVETTRSRKEFRPILMAPATDKHPAQIKETHEDVIVGTFKSTHLSGAIPVARIEELLRRVEKLSNAVKVAREQANLVEAVPMKSSVLLDYIFAPTK